MTSLENVAVKDGYGDLLQVSNSNSGIDATLRPVEDGGGTACPLELSATKVNIASGFQLGGVDVTASGAELNYVDGVTSAIQTQLDAKAGSSFKTVAVSGQSDVVADSPTDTLTLAAGSNVTLTTNAGTDTITITAAGGSPGGSSGQLQYNDSSAFGGAAALTYAASGNHLTATAQATTDVPVKIKLASGTPTGAAINVTDSSDNSRGGITPQTTSSTDPLALFLRPGGRSYYIATFDSGGSFRFHRSDTAGYVQIAPDTGRISLVGTASYGYILGGGTVVITGTEGGGQSVVDLNRRPGDDSSGVGGSVRCWTRTSQSQPGLQVLAPGGATSMYNITPAGLVQQSGTVTAAGTTGAQTINKPCGSVNFAAAATSLVVTNSLVTANSIVLATILTNDGTMTSVWAVPASGSFTLYANAGPAAETRVGWQIINTL